MLIKMTNTAAYGWRSAALFTSEMSVFDAFKGGNKRTTPAAAHHAATRAWNGPIT